MNPLPPAPPDNGGPIAAYIPQNPGTPVMGPGIGSTVVPPLPTMAGLGATIPPSSGSAMDPTRIAQMFMSNMMALMMRLTKPEKNIQSPDTDLSIPPNRTLYVNNLNDRLKVPRLINDLRQRFSPFGEIVDIIALKSFWRRGQVFVAFRTQDSATDALQALQGQLYEGKPMRINYAKEESDCFKREDGTFTARPKGPKKPRAILEREATLLEQFQQLQQQMLAFQRQGSLTRGAGMGPSTPSLDLGPPSGGGLAESLMGSGAVAPLSPVGGVDQSSAGEAGEEDGRKRKAFSMSLKGVYPAETESKKRKEEVVPVAGSSSGGGPVQNPPNKTLFLEKLPSDCDEGELIAVFSSYEGFERVRLIAVRNVAFVDFKTTSDAMLALEGRQEKLLRGEIPIVASFAKR